MRVAPRLPAVVEAALTPFFEEGRGDAVFDADGTLWRGDVGEDLLRFLASERHLRSAHEGVFARYEALHATAPVEAYRFAVEVMAGLEVERLDALCADFFERRFLGRVFPWVRPLLAALEARQVRVWICSASPKWIVEAGARQLGLPREQVIGVDAEVAHGRLSARVLEPVTAGPGKVTWLERRGARPGFACGNGELDLDMLEAARHRLVIAPFDGAENSLVAHARRHRWPILKT